jgi:hypothetical protein
MVFRSDCKYDTDPGNDVFDQVRDGMPDILEQSNGNVREGEALRKLCTKRWREDVRVILMEVGRSGEGNVECRSLLS